MNRSFHILNPQGSDPFRAFPKGAGEPGDAGHPPVNYHAYAACTGGDFHRDVATLPDNQDPMLLLLRRDLRLGLKTLRFLRKSGRKVAVSLKESGAHQVAALLNNARKLTLFREICAEADLALSSTPDLVPFYLGAGARQAVFIPTPYPVDVPCWDFSTPPETRRGIFIGTREFDTPSRSHLAALLAVRTLGEPVTVLNLDGWRGRRKLRALGDATGQLRVHEERLPYADYLRLMASHRLVFQLDRSAVPGQVAGDALLCRIPCIGGDGATERLAFPDLCGHGRDTGELVEKTRRLLACADMVNTASTTTPSFYQETIEKSQQLAKERLGFGVIAGELAKL